MQAYNMDGELAKRIEENRRKCHMKRTWNWSDTQGNKKKSTKTENYKNNCYVNIILYIYIFQTR